MSHCAISIIAHFSRQTYTAMHNRYDRRIRRYNNDDDDDNIGIAHGLTVYVGLAQARPNQESTTVSAKTANGKI